jgi:hypothetical protein
MDYNLVIEQLLRAYQRECSDTLDAGIQRFDPLQLHQHLVTAEKMEDVLMVFGRALLRRNDKGVQQLLLLNFIDSPASVHIKHYYFIYQIIQNSHNPQIIIQRSTNPIGVILLNSPKIFYK